MLAVTTRNKLHSWRFCLPMLRARRYVKEQLVATPGLIRSVTAVSSPTEFLTMTVWESRQAMFDFMSSGAHETFMWMFARWSSSFWSMRWLPTMAEEGVWEGLSLANLVGLDSHSLNATRPQIPQLPLLEQRKGRTHGARFVDPSGSGVYAVAALVEATSPERVWALLYGVRELRRKAGHPQLLRWSVGSVEPRRFLVLTLWRDVPGKPEDVQEPTEGVRILSECLKASWTMCWTAGEYEIGHWNGLRLRQLASARLRQQRMKSETSEHPDSESDIK